MNSIVNNNKTAYAVNTFNSTFWACMQPWMGLNSQRILTVNCTCLENFLITVISTLTHPHLSMYTVDAFVALHISLMLIVVMFPHSLCPL